MTAAIVLILMVFLLVIGLPVALSIGISGAVGLYMFGGFPILAGIMKTAPFSTADSYEIITIPMFILMAEFVILSGVASDLFRAATIWVGRVRGGTAMATALAGAGFGAISGSSTASAATLASTSLPAMMEQGYDPKLAGGVVAISGTLAMLIPPSIALVIFGILANVPVSKLLMAGVVPGIIVTVAIMATVAILVRIDPSAAPAGRAYTFADKFGSLKRVGPMLVLFAAVTGTIYTGIATPTEASALGAFCAALIAAWERKLTPAGVWVAVRSAAHTTAMILFIILGAYVFGYFFALTKLTDSLAFWVGSLDMSRWVIIAIILVIYLALGFFMDQSAILILTVPVVLPIIVKLGFDPVWFGVLVVVTAEVGMVTPPLGLNVFVVARYTKRPLSEIFQGVMPHFWAHLVVIAILTAFPALVLWLPSTMK